MRLIPLLLWTFLFPLSAYAGMSLRSHEISNTVNNVNSGTLGQASSYQDQECRDLRPGEHRTVNESAGDSLTTVPRRYRVTRDAKKPEQLDLDLNLSFMAPFEISDKATKEEAAAALQKMDEKVKYFEDKTKQCFDEYKDKLRDHAGNVLRVNIINDPYNREVPPNKVRIDNPTDRANSENWTPDIDCPAIIHECLHLTGLVDGYIETDNAKTGGKLYDCRHRENDDSIMSNQDKALESDVEVNACQCQEEKCRQAENSMDTGGNMNCPEGYTGTPRKMTFSAAEAWIKQLNANGKGIAVRVKWPKEQKRPALKNAQVAAIAKPRCSRDNVYMTCAKNAYRTQSNGGCAETGPECSSPGWSE